MTVINLQTQFELTGEAGTINRGRGQLRQYQLIVQHPRLVLELVATGVARDETLFAKIEVRRLVRGSLVVKPGLTRIAGQLDAAEAVQNPAMAQILPRVRVAASPARFPPASGGYILTRFDVHPDDDMLSRDGITGATPSIYAPGEPVSGNERNVLNSAWQLAATLLLAGLLSACENAPQNVTRQSSSAYTDTENTVLGEAIRDDLASHPGHSGFHLLSNGLDAFAARALLAYNAERSIDAQYYLLHNDLVGRLFINALLQAADRGVRVRLLVDDMALDDDKDIAMAALDAHPQIEIRVFNPFSRQSGRWWQVLARFDDVTRRMHNKSFTVDNQFSVLGGRNIGNEYFEADPDLAFSDLDAIAIGPVVAEISSSFDQYWNSDASYPVAALLGNDQPSQDLDKLRNLLSAYVEQRHDSEYQQAVRTSVFMQRIQSDQFHLDWGNARVLFDDPAKVSAARDQTQLHLSTQLGSLKAQTARELTIFSPYFVPGRKGVEDIQELCARGVRVRILTNSLASTDVPAVHAGYSKYRKYLLRAGAELYEVDHTLSREQRKEKNAGAGPSTASLHAKSFVIDRQRLFIGSMNLDPRSVVENTEIGVIIDSTDIATEMSEWFDQNIDAVAFRLALETDDRGNEILVWYRATDSGDQRFTTEPNTGFWRRFSVGVLRLLPIESLL